MEDSSGQKYVDELQGIICFSCDAEICIFVVINVKLLLQNVFKGIKGLTEKISSFMDVTKEGKGEQVSKIWKKIISEDNIWQAVLKQEVLQIQGFHFYLFNCSAYFSSADASQAILEPDLSAFDSRAKK